VSDARVRHVPFLYLASSEEHNMQFNVKHLQTGLAYRGKV